MRSTTPLPPTICRHFIAASEQAGHILDRHIDKSGILGEDARGEVTDYIRTKQIKPDTMLALRELVEGSGRGSGRLQGVQVGSG